MDLYQPLYMTRPTVVPELFAGLRPQVYDGGIAADRVRGLMSGDAPGVDSLRSGRRIGYGPDGKPLTMQLNEVVTTGLTASGYMDAMSSVQAIASAAKLGELFQY